MLGTRPATVIEITGEPTPILTHDVPPVVSTGLYLTIYLSVPGRALQLNVAVVAVMLVVERPEISSVNPLQFSSMPLQVSVALG